MRLKARRMTQSNVKKRPFVELKNCLKFYSNGQHIERIDVLKALKVDGTIPLDGIDTISQIFNNKYWFITLKENLKSNDFLNKVIKIKENEFVLKDANERIAKEQKYKVLWLPHNFEKSRIKRFFESNGYDVVKIEDEFMKEEGFEQIKNGNFLINATL